MNITKIINSQSPDNKISHVFVSDDRWAICGVDQSVLAESRVSKIGGLVDLCKGKNIPYIDARNIPYDLQGIVRVLPCGTAAYASGPFGTGNAPIEVSASIVELLGGEVKGIQTTKIPSNILADGDLKFNLMSQGFLHDSASMPYSAQQMIANNYHAMHTRITVRIEKSIKHCEQQQAASNNDFKRRDNNEAVLWTQRKQACQKALSHVLFESLLYQNQDVTLETSAERLRSTIQNCIDNQSKGLKDILSSRFTPESDEVSKSLQTCFNVIEEECTKELGKQASLHL
ncbi:hypothetical protein [Neptuniibacter sp. QD37_11]|uniref:hypothetical protein n=1 Tax=Neptuniibacter sp. QD37_11 TaxID=3398209 RepID=UPI0039F47636